MSADNMILVKEYSEVWWVWMDFASENTWHYSRDLKARNFETKVEALEFAYQRCLEEDVVEYGVWLLE